MAIPALVMIAGGLALMAGQMFPPLQEKWSQWMFDFWPNRIPNIAELIVLRYRGIINDAAFLDLCEKNGFNNDRARHLYQSQEKLIGEGDLVTAWRRGIIGENDLDKILHSHQYSDENINTIKKVTEYFPSAADLVTFAVREVYSPEVVQKFGQMEDLPERFITEARKAGLPEDQARNYWAAHWGLPSPLQGFEMLHRGVIDKSTLEMLLRALDVMPYWRDKLTEIAYNPLTRVDVRRMYGLGVLDRAGVKKAYLDIGYNDTNAELMTDFTIKYESNEDIGLTRASISKAYKTDLITREQFAEYLKRLGYAEDTINFYIEQVEYEKAEEQIELFVEDARQRYRLGDITIEDFRTVLNTLDLPATYVDSVINKELVSTYAKRKLPTKADVENWLKMQLIDETVYSDYMLRQGYSEADIIKYLEEINKEIDTSKAKPLSITIYQRWLKSKIMSEKAFTEVALNIGISPADIERFITEVKLIWKAGG